MKDYRYLIHHSFLSKYYYDRYKIRLRFSLFPQKIDGKWTVFSFYYSLWTISSSVNFGGQMFIQYKLTKRSKSIFGFREHLKEKGIIKNQVLEKRMNMERRSSWPAWIREIMDNA